MSRDVTYDRILRPRLLAMAMYVAYLLASVAFIVLPTPNTLEEETGLLTLFVWHGFLLVGGFTAAFGVITKRLVIEAFGVPLLGAALAAYAAVLFYTSWSDIATGPRVGFALVLIGAFLGLIGRLFEVVGLLRIAIDMEERSGDL